MGRHNSLPIPLGRNLITDTRTLKTNVQKRVVGRTPANLLP